MHPALSVIFFTLTSGLGYGIMMMLALTTLIGILHLEPNQTIILGIIGLSLITAGLISSTFHLANPKNAWRAFNRFRTSWLSREGVFAVIFYPFALAFLFLLWQGNINSIIFYFLSAMTFFIAFITVFSTGMIYACLKTIRQWHTPLVPTNYLLASFMSGILALIMLMALLGIEISQPFILVAISLITTAGVIKAIYFFWIGKPEGPTINTATGFTLASMRLLDVGHSAGTFLTQEFGYEIPSCKVMMLRFFSTLFAYILPLILLVQYTLTETNLLLYFPIISTYIGLGVERWLFFAEARHVVNLYHGAQRT